MNEFEIDELDHILGKHYCEELDFIINGGIKCPIGQEVGKAVAM